ncbi:ThiF family adenylyltransferase [Lysinibacillus fusiformis]|uniref:ThiF family adenylyltransferase n=1 Tax=Lysinibacillus fusiformis TaxID=28031 RepID=UPI0023AA0D53|nr:E2/UBC family protein [Lysinibacillus fusiformis]WEA41642.1 E2/UBC family protein [Lysinibacillus fusiformis]
MNFKNDIIKRFSELELEIKEISIEEINSNRAVFVNAFQITELIGNDKLIIQIGIPKEFPFVKPMLFIKNHNDFTFIPHIERDGYICYSSEDGLIIDSNKPIRILEEAYKRSLLTIKSGTSKKRHLEFQKEFEINWMRLDNVEFVDSFFEELPTELKVIKVLCKKDFNKHIIFDSNQKNIISIIQNIYSCDIKEFTENTGIYIPLRKNSIVNFPYKFNMWSFKQIKRIINKNISSSVKRKLKNLNFSNSDIPFYVFLNIPTNQGNIFLGILVKPDLNKLINTKKFNPLKLPATTVEIIPLSIKRHSLNFLLHRTQGFSFKEDKKVIVFGAGSIGGKIAVELVKAGISNLFIVDKDIFDVDNIYRHDLGFESLYPSKKVDYNYPKSMLMKNRIEISWPHANVESYFMDVLHFIDQYKTLIKSADLIISALGAPTVELFLNNFIHTNNINTPVIYSWLDPLGIGGHVLITNNNSTKGCYRCLYTTEDDNNSLHENKASFAAPNQIFTTSMLGCSNEFTQYSSLDSTDTANLTVRTAINILNKGIDGNPILSWKGDPKQFLKRGYTLSNRFNLSTEQLEEYCKMYVVKNCLVCGRENR